MKNKFITSALPYVNNSPHLGNIVGCVLSADVYARFCRKNGHNVSFICGSDEYGTATEMRAFELKKSPKEVCDQMVDIHKRVYKWFSIDFDYFGRTSDDHHRKNVQLVFKNLYENGFFEEKLVMQFFCDDCKIFLSDRFVCGTCYYCGSDDAKGDQCDGCGHLLKSTDLINPKCSICKKLPNMVETEHLFFKLPDFKKFLKSQNYNRWTKNAIEITKSWLKKDLHSRCMTRDLKFNWGVPVPLEKYKSKVFYVWFDAPIGYLTFLKNHHKEEFDEFYKNCEWIQFMGKDNVSFHSIIFQSILKGCSERRGEFKDKSKGKSEEMSEISDDDKNDITNKKDNNNNSENKNENSEDKNDDNKNDLKTTPKIAINATEYLMFENKKFSKSRKIGIFGEDLLENRMGENTFWRFYLMKIRPETKDANFSFSDFKSTVNDLINTYGNLCNRVLKYIKKKGGKVIYKKNDEDVEFITKINNLYNEYKDVMDRIELRNGLKICMDVCVFANQYLQKTFAKKEVKSDMPFSNQLNNNITNNPSISKFNEKELQFNSFSLTFSVIVLVTLMFEPFIPDKANEIFKMIGIANGNFPEKMIVFKEFELKKEISQPFRYFNNEELTFMEKFEKFGQ
ncbi:Methionine--tRNA ligase, cytoplasmic [Dictyocoela muelleri]|nr:Methionine--tRNA ligase, cytoplasmic [Dictyocoela muelleri]